MFANNCFGEEGGETVCGLYFTSKTWRHEMKSELFTAPEVMFEVLQLSRYLKNVFII